MRAIYDQKSCKILLDNEAIKAIRFCYGVNVDLRVSLAGLPIEPLKRWIEDNKIRILGQRICGIDTATDKYKDMMDDIIRQIIR